MRVSIPLSVACLVLIASSAYAQPKGVPADAIPPEIAKEMQLLVGEWEFEFERDGKIAKETWLTRWADGKHCQTARAMGNGAKATSIMGYDKSTEQITELCFSANGDYFLFKYKIKEPGLWEGTGIGIDHGKPFTEKLRLERTGRGQLRWTAYEFVLGGKDQPDLVANAKRVKKTTPTVDIPNKAMGLMEFFAGEWDGVTEVNGAPLSTGSDKRRWSPGKHCLQMTGASDQDGNPIASSGICGWDCTNQQLVETWHVSDGHYVIVRYPLDEMNGDKYGGTLTVTLPDGMVINGTCELNKTESGFVWIAQWEQNGQKMVRKGIATRRSPK